MQKTLQLILPAHNESGNILPIYEEICAVLASTNYAFEIIFVNDGSTDDTLAKIKKLADEDPKVKYINLSRNFGKDNALFAGLKSSFGDIIITIDADLQHPPSLIPKMINHWESGAEIVFAYREKGNNHASLIKRITSKIFYKLLNVLSEFEIEDGTSDFRLIDKKVVNVLKDLQEENPFFRGLIKWVGFKQIGIPYTVNQRNSGDTKYNSSNLLKLGIQGLTSFTVRPLYLAIYLGFIFSLLSIGYIPYVLFSFIYGHPISGWASLIVTVVFLGGVQLMILGIIGLYLGKIFIQSKQRPHYIVKETNL
ncbi:MAG TPA: glycosyltransferase [Chitinophagaceae bacterium]|nr:glycosyltransferase [Chitinophagaceae bacterium]HCT23486.1 glycosyltransferase [Chitinophagaceae bacterium]